MKLLSIKLSGTRVAQKKKMIAIRKDKSFFFFKERVAKNFELQGFVDLAIPHVLCLQILL